MLLYLVCTQLIHNKENNVTVPCLYSADPQKQGQRTAQTDHNLGYMSICYVVAFPHALCLLMFPPDTFCKLFGPRSGLADLYPNMR